MLVDYVRVYTEKKPGPYQLISRSSGDGRLYVTPELEEYPEGTEVTLLAHPAIGNILEHWYGADLAPNRQATLVMNRDVELEARFNPPGEMLLNSNFADGMDYWFFREADGVEVTYEADNGYLEVTPITLASNLTDVQIGQFGMNLKQGETYRLSFDGWTEEDASISWGLVHGDQQNVYVSLTANLTSERQTFSTVYRMDAPTDPEAGVGFSFGNFTDKGMIDNVSLVKVSEPELTRYQAWKNAHGVGESLDLDDSDMDGTPVLLEYAFGRDPEWTDPPLFTYEVDGNTLNLNLPILDKKAVDVGVEVQESSDLDVWKTLSGNSIHLDGDPHFVRLKAAPIENE